MSNENFDIVGKIAAIERVSIDCEEKVDVVIKSEVAIDSNYYNSVKDVVVLNIKDLIKKLKAFAELSESETINLSIQDEEILEYDSERTIRKAVLSISNYFSENNEKNRRKECYGLNLKKVEKVIAEKEAFEEKQNESEE